MSELNYLEDLKIDESNLNYIVDTQPVISMRYIELYCNKLDEYNEQKRKVQIEKANLEEVFAKIYLQNKRSGEKITEKENESMILTNQDYKNKQKQYFDEIKKLNDLEKDVNIFDGVCKNMQARKNMIEEKIKLIQLNWNGNVRQNTINRINDKLNR